MLDFYYSTMQGGKSTALLQRRYNLTSIGQRVLVMTSALDDRYGVGIGHSIPDGGSWCPISI